MKINSDFKDLLQLLGDASVRFLVVGGYAVMKYTEPYHTKDLDIWIEPTEENANRMLEVLRQFGAPGGQVTVDDLTNPDLIYQIGVEPVRVDVMGSVSGFKFEEAWEHRVETDYGGVVAAETACLRARHRSEP
jgi:hypothetical protein